MVCIPFGLQIPLGVELSGPFMNPAFAFSWFYHLKGADLWEHIAVYWVGCLAGSYLAGLLWWFLTAPAKKVSRHSALSDASNLKKISEHGSRDSSHWSCAVLYCRRVIRRQGWLPQSRATARQQRRLL